MADNKLKIGIEVQPEAFITQQDIKNFQKTIALALKDLKVPPGTIKNVTGLGDNVVKQVLGDTGQFKRGIKAYAEALEKLSNLPFERGRGRQEAEADFKARQRQSLEQRKKEIKAIEALFATEAKSFGQGQVKLIQEASKRTNAALRTNLLKLSESYKQSLRIVNREIERSAEFKKGLDLIQATGLDDKALSQLKKKELDAIRVVREVSARVSKEIRATRDQIAATSKTAGVDAPEVLLTSLGLSAQQIKEFETRAAKAISAQDRVARQISQRRARLRETEPFLRPLEAAPQVGVARAARPAPAPARGVAGPQIDQILDRAFRKAGGTFEGRGVDIDTLRKEFPAGVSRAQQDQLLLRAGDQGRAALYPQENPRALRQETAKAALRVAGEDVHRIYLDAAAQGAKRVAAEAKKVASQVVAKETGAQTKEDQFRRAFSTALKSLEKELGANRVSIKALRERLTQFSKKDFAAGVRQLQARGDVRVAAGTGERAIVGLPDRSQFRQAASQLLEATQRAPAAGGAARPPVVPPVAAAAAPAAPAPRPGAIPGETAADLQKRIAGLKKRETTLREILNLEKLTDEERQQYNKQLLETTKLLDKITTQEKKLTAEQRQAEAAARKAQQEEIKRAQQRVALLKRLQQARALLGKDVSLFTPEDQRTAILLRDELGKTTQEIQKGRNELQLSTKQSQQLGTVWAQLKIKQEQITAAQRKRIQLEKQQEAQARKEQARLEKQKQLFIEVNREAKRFEELKGVDIKLLDPARLRLQKKEIQDYSASLNKLEKELLKDAKAAKRLGVTLQEVRQRKVDAARVTEQLNEQLGRMTGRFSSASRVLQQFVRYAIGYGGLYRLIGIFNQLGRSVVDLQQDLKSIQAVTNSTEQDMIGIARAITDVALSTRFSVREISSAAQLLGQAGVEASEIQGVLQSTANFASAVGGSLETAADLVSTFRNVFTELSDKAIADQLTTAVNISKLASEDLKTILSLSAQTARGYQLTSDQYLAAVTTLRNAGIKASTVATGLRQSLIEIFSPDNRTLKILQGRYAELGEILSMEQIQARFFDIQQERNPLTSALRELERLGISGGAESQFGRIFDVRAMNVIRALIKDIGALETDAAELTFGGSAAKAAATQMEALNAQMTNLGAAFTTFGFQLAEGPIAGLTELVKVTVDAVKSLSALDLELKAVGSEGIGDKLVSGLAAGVGVGAFARGGIAKKVAAGAVAGGGVAAAEIGAAGDSTSTFLAGLAAVFGGIALSSQKSTKEVDTMNKLREKGVGKARIVLKGLRFAITRFFTGWIGWALLAWEAFDALSDYMDSQTTSFEKIEKSAIAAAKASRAATAKFEQDFQDFENIRLTTANQESAAGTAARSIEDLQTRFQVQAQELSNFVQGLGGQTQKQTEEVRAILQQFSGRARAGEAGTRAREALRQEIGDVLDLRKDQLEQLDFQLNRLLAEEGDINRFSAQYVESFNRAIGDARAAGDEATATQQALLEAYQKLEPEEIVELTSLAGQAREGTVDLIEQVLRRANALVKGEMSRRQDESLGSKFEQELQTTATLLAELQQQPGGQADFQRTLNQFVEANAGMFGTWQEVYDALILELNEASADITQKAEAGFIEKGLTFLAQASPLAFQTRPFVQAREAGRQQQFAAGQRREAGSAGAGILVSESRASYARGIERENQNRLDELRAHHDDMGSLQTKEQGIYNAALKLLPKQFKGRLAGFQQQGQTGELGGFLQQDEGGRQRVNAELQKAFKAWTESVIKARSNFEADQKRLRQERLAAINTQKFTVAQALKDAKTRGEDFSVIQGLVEQQAALQTEENALKTKELEGTAQFDAKSKQLRADNLRILQQRDIQLKEELRASQQRVARLKQQEAEFKASSDESSAVAAAFKGEKKEAFDLAASSIIERKNALDAQRESAELVQDERERQLKLAQLAEEELGLYQDALVLRARVVDTLDRELAFRAQTGTTRQGVIEQTRFQAAGGKFTLGQREEPGEVRLEALREQDERLAKRVLLQQEIITQENDSAEAQTRLYDLEIQRFEVQKQMAQLEGEQQARREGIFGDLAAALNPEQLRSRLEEMNNGLNNVANTIQDKLVTGIDSLAGGLANAITTGKSLGETLKQTFFQTTQSITQAILKAIILKGILAATGGGGGGGFLAGLIGGGGAKGAATGAVISDSGSLETSSSGGGGIVKGPSGLDNILGAIKSRAGKFIEPIGVTAKESILNRKATSLLGTDFIHKLNAGRLRGFVQGGIVRPRDVIPPKTSNSTNVTVDNGSPKIVNVMDPSLVGDFLDSPEGDRIIVNKIERNQAAIATVT